MFVFLVRSLVRLFTSGSQPPCPRPPKSRESRLHHGPGLSPPRCSEDDDDDDEDDNDDDDDGTTTLQDWG